MKWSIQELNKFKEQCITIDCTIDLKESLQARDHEVLDISPVHVTGQIAINKSEYIVYLQVKCSVVVPSTRSLEPVEVSLDFALDEVYMTQEQYKNRLVIDDQDDYIMVLDKDYIDLIPVIEDYILLNIPSQILSEEEQNSEDLPSGNNWTLISEEDYLKQKESEQSINPQMAKLQELFDTND